MIELQLLPCTKASVYKYHALAHIFTAFPIRDANGVQSSIYRGAFFAKIVNMLRLLANFTEELHSACLTGLSTRLCPITY